MRLAAGRSEGLVVSVPRFASSPPRCAATLVVLSQMLFAKPSRAVTPNGGKGNAGGAGAPSDRPKSHRFGFRAGNLLERLPVSRASAQG